MGAPIGARELSAILGVEVGETLPRLVNLAFRIAPRAPALAFEDLWFILPWLDGKTTIDDLRSMGTPEGVLPFATTGGDFGHYGFLMEGEIPTEERPIVFVMPSDEEVTDVVAPNLRALLGLIASGPVDRMLRSWTDEDWAQQAKDFGGQRVLSARRRVANLLCRLPGVKRPASPSAIVRSVPGRTFETFPGVEVEPSPELAQSLEESQARTEAEAEEPSWLAHRLSIEAFEALRDERFAEAARRAESGLDNRYARARCLTFAAEARWKLGESEQAQQLLKTLVEEWLDDSPAPPPYPHPRAKVDTETLEALVRLVDPPDSGSILDQVSKAGPPPEHADFF